MIRVSTPERSVVLIGGGHSHLEVLRRWQRRPPVDAALRVILDDPRSVYSGMVPGFVAGEYSEDELTIDVEAAATRAGAEVTIAEALSVDVDERVIHLRGAEPMRYDLASLNVGGSIRGLPLSGVSTHALATRPINRFVRTFPQYWSSRLDALRTEPIAVVGGGFAGVELAFALAARLRRAGLAGAEVQVFDRSGFGVAGRGRNVRARLMRAMTNAGIKVVGGETIVDIKADTVTAASGRCYRSALTVWATGGAPPAIIEASRISCDPGGFARTNRELEVRGADGLFAVGDCAVQDGNPPLPRAGVYAVKQGPILFANITRRLAGRPGVPYRPQRDVLQILNLGDGSAIATKYGVAVRGRLMRQWKDRLDRGFLARHHAKR